MSRRLFIPMLLLSLSACGMTDDPREDEKRTTYLTIPDPQFEKYLLETYDLNLDGRFSRYEAEHILVIDCPGREIERLQGIEYFIRLRELYCADNRIEELDLSRNVNLERVDCARNELVQLNVDGIRPLNTLDCSENRLPLLDLIANPVLWDLRCHTNELRRLDVSHCARTMKRVDARFNPLETLCVADGQHIENLQSGGADVVVR